MSWLYSIIFASLMAASGGGVAGDQPKAVNFDNPTAAQIPWQDVSEKFDQTYPLPANGRVSLSNINGSVVVETWDRNEVRVEATKTADSRESLDGVTIEVAVRGDAVRVEADWGNWSFRNGDRNRRVEVTFKLTVPRGAKLDAIETVNGSVTLSNLTNYTKASAVNGNVNASDLRGTAALSTVNGEVRSEFERIEPGSNISLNTVNGSVRLTLPSDVNATVKADSLNGEIMNEYGLPVRKGQYIGRDLYGKLGSGDAQIKLNSVNGPLSIMRRKDGRTLSPATNLLTTKSGADIDVDVDIESAKAAAASVRNSQKQAAAAMKAAQAEMERIRPELESVKVTVDAEKINAVIAENVARQAEALNRMAEFSWSGRAPSMRRKSNSFKVSKNPGIEIEAPGCDVTVRSWGRDEVRYILTEVGSGKNAVEIVEQVNDGSVNLKAVNALARGARAMFPGLSDVRLEVMVPAASNLTVRTDGAIRVAGVNGVLDLNGEDQSVDIRDASGTLKLQAEDAQVRVIGYKGTIDARIVDGSMFLEGSFDRISTQAADGTVTLTLPANTNAVLDSNTDVRFEGFTPVRDGSRYKIGAGGPEYKFSFGEGSLTLRSSSLIEIN